MTTLVAIALVLCLVPQASRSQERGVPGPGRFVGGVVDGVGQIYVLRRDSLETSNLGEAPESIPLDVRRTLADSNIRFIGFHAIALNQKKEPAVLWSGVRHSGAGETYVTFIGSGVNVRLEHPVILATGLAFDSTDEIFIFGLMRHQGPVSLVHHFARNGSYLKSFHPHVSDKVDDVAAWADLGRSRVIVTGNAVYVASPFLSDIVSEYSTSGEFVRQHDFGKSSASSSSRRKLLTIFAKDGEALADSQVNTEGSATKEIHRLRDGQLVSSIPVSDAPGPVFGILPDGRSVYRNTTQTAKRDSIQIR
jgi:hypothetical protein